jgi:hypothetical protein
VTDHVCRAIVDINIPEEDIPSVMTEQMLVRCGEPATKYQEGCANLDDGWCCGEHYVDPKEWAEL